MKIVIDFFIFLFLKITAGLYGWPTPLFSTIFPYCRPWLQAIYVPVKLKLQQIPPRANPGHLTVHRALGGGGAGFEPDLSLVLA